MAGVRVDLFRAGWARALALCLAIGLAQHVLGQGAAPGITRGGANVPDMGPPVVTGPRAGTPGAPTGPEYIAAPPAAVDEPIDTLVEQQIIDIQVTGNSSVSTQKILSIVSMKVGRPFDQLTLSEDVKKLLKLGWFQGVRAIREQVTGGVRITIQVSERPTLAYVKYIGNEKLSDKRLAKKTELKKGAPFEIVKIDEGKRKMEEYYKEKGYNDIQISILEGNKQGDRGAIYLINEGVIQKVWKVQFEGNSIASDKRLRTQVGSKPPILYFFKGEVDRKKIDEDIEKLTAYYRSLGFFRARVGREIQFDQKEKWATLTFVVDEGPRYIVRDVKFVGNQHFTTEQLKAGVKLKAGDFFSQANLIADRTMITDAYGSKGYVFANIQPVPTFLEEPDQLDVVFNLEEGGRFAVGRIDVHIEGDTKGGNPHTRFHTVLNRLQFRPGDIADTQKIRNAERRLKASALFVTDPQKGNPPKITFSPPDSDEETGVARRKRKSSDSFRGQSPDNEPGEEDPTLRPGESVAITLFPEQQAGSAALSVTAMSPQARSLRPDPNTSSASNPSPSGRGQGEGPANAEATVRPSLNGARLPASPAQQPQRPQSAWPQQQPAPQVDLQQEPVEQLIIRGQGPEEPASYGDASTDSRSGQAGLNWRNRPGTATTSAGNSTGAAGYDWDQDAGFVKRVRQPAPASNPYQNLPIAGRGAAAWAPDRPSVSRTGPTVPAAPPVRPFDEPLIVRGQNTYGGTAIQPISPAPQSVSAYPPVGSSGAGGGQLFGQSPDPNAPPGGVVPPIAAPDFNGPPPGGFTPPENIAPPDPIPQLRSLDMGVETAETQTGRFMFGAGVNSNAGVVGSVVIDEQNFDWKRVPTSMEDWRNGTAFRGAGQHFRIELAPGTVVSRYVVSFNEPYLYDTNVNFGISGQFYQRFFNDWVEQRAGGRVSLGYQFRPDITGVVALRAEAVDIKDPRILIPDLAQVLGITQLYSGQFKIVNDTRDNTFFPTQGRYIEVSFEQAFGNFAFPKATLDMRKFFTVASRPDGSGKQILSLYGFAGATGKNTPIYERFFLGGIGTLRGFYYRGASPTIDTVEVGGDFATYGTVEYVFPISADDMFRGAAFVDAGIDARTANISGMDVRVAPGLGIRVSVPAMGPAPISIDFAVPVLKTSNDRTQLINFSMGVSR